MTRKILLSPSQALPMHLVWSLKKIGKVMYNFSQRRCNAAIVLCLIDQLLFWEYFISVECDLHLLISKSFLFCNEALEDNLQQCNSKRIIVTYDSFFTYARVYNLLYNKYKCSSWNIQISESWNIWKFKSSSKTLQGTFIASFVKPVSSIECFSWDEMDANLSYDRKQWSACWLVVMEYNLFYATCAKLHRRADRNNKIVIF